LRFFINILFLTLFSVSLYASTYNLTEIQNDFYTNVAIKPLYEKYYGKTIDELCKKHSKVCYNSELLKIMDNTPLAENSLIQKSLAQRKKKFHIRNNYWKRAKEHLSSKQDAFTSSQFISLVDLSKQVLVLVLWDNDTKTFHPIGFDFISSGNINKEVDTNTGEDHYLKTPSGLFDIQSGWRSDGKVLDDNTTMPYGQKNTYVFYFGTQKSIRYNTFDKNGTKIKDMEKWKLITDKLHLALHAHKSSAPLGQPNSYGCIRISNELNHFLDNNLVFFKELYNNKEEWKHPYNRPPKEPKNYQFAGKYLFVLDNI